MRCAPFWVHAQMPHLSGVCPRIFVIHRHCQHRWSDVTRQVSCCHRKQTWEDAPAAPSLPHPAPCTILSSCMRCSIGATSAQARFAMFPTAQRAAQDGVPSAHPRPRHVGRQQPAAGGAARRCHRRRGQGAGFGLGAVYDLVFSTRAARRRPRRRRRGEDTWQHVMFQDFSCEETKRAVANVRTHARRNSGASSACCVPHTNGLRQGSMRDDRATEGC